MTHTLHPSPAELAELRRNPHMCGLTGCAETAVAAATICSGFADPAPFPICAKHLSPVAWSSDASWRIVPLADLLGGAA